MPQSARFPPTRPATKSADVSSAHAPAPASGSIRVHRWFVFEGESEDALFHKKINIYVLSKNILSSQRVLPCWTEGSTAEPLTAAQADSADIPDRFSFGLDESPGPATVGQNWCPMRSYYFVVIGGLIAFLVAFGFLYRGFRASFGRKCLQGAIDAARKKDFAEAIRLTCVAVRFAPHFRRVDALHTFYEAIQLEPKPRDLEERISSLAAMIEKHRPTLSEVGWSNPSFRLLVVVAGVIILALRFLALFAK
ncbi:MAG: hypothetical protein NTV51_14525 [Verrucomicrobia bacterium]|nr:hypothetical protein [Verrucomicrobiota bacterium]